MTSTNRGPRPTGFISGVGRQVRHVKSESLRSTVSLEREIWWIIDEICEAEEITLDTFYAIARSMPKARTPVPVSLARTWRLIVFRYMRSGAGWPPQKGRLADVCQELEA